MATAGPRVLALLVSLLAACGGGGGSGDPVAPATPLAITEAPRTQQLAVGESAIFAVAAEGNGAISYQWFRDGVPIEGEVRPRLEVRAGAESPGHRYWVRISDASGSLTSEPVQIALRAAGDWQRWSAAPAGPPGLLNQGPDQFFHQSGNDVSAFGFALFLARPDLSTRAREMATQGRWDPIAQVRDWTGVLPGREPRPAGPVRAQAYAADGRLWVLDLRVPPGEEPQPRLISTQLSRQMCRDASLIQDRVDPRRSLLVFSLPQPEQGCNAPDTAQYRVVRLNHQPFEAPIELPPRSRPLFALQDAQGTITGLVVREAAGRVLRLDDRDFRPEPVLSLGAGAIDTLVRPGPGQPWWVFGDGNRIVGVRVDAPGPWVAQILYAAGAAGAALPRVEGVARIDGQLSLLLWDPPAAGAAGGRLRACAVSGCPEGPRELLAPSLGYTTLARVPDSEGLERAWFVLGDRQPTSASSTFTVAQVREDGGVSVRLNTPNDPQHNPERQVTGLFGDWLLSVAGSGVHYGLPMDAGLPERRVGAGAMFTPMLEATRVNHFWFDWQSSAGLLELRDAAGELVKALTDVYPANFRADWKGSGDELLVIRVRAPGPVELVGIDVLTGAVRTEYGPLPDLRDGGPMLLDPPRTGQVVHFTLDSPSTSHFTRHKLLAIRVGTPGVHLLVDPGS